MWEKSRCGAFLPNSPVPGMTIIAEVWCHYISIWLCTVWLLVGHNLQKKFQSFDISVLEWESNCTIAFQIHSKSSSFVFYSIWNKFVIATLQAIILSSLIPRLSPPPVFDHVQYAKTEGEGLGDLVVHSGVTWWR